MKINSSCASTKWFSDAQSNYGLPFTLRRNRAGLFRAQLGYRILGCNAATSIVQSNVLRSDVGAKLVYAKPPVNYESKLDSVTKNDNQ
jgi:hypothetical protein